MAISLRAAKAHDLYLALINPETPGFPVFRVAQQPAAHVAELLRDINSWIKLGILGNIGFVNAPFCRLTGG
jgi:hypothetical protein